jgi:chemotaxis protein histidine kinase CheA
MDLPLYDIDLGDLNSENGMFRISLVARPAIEENFIHFNEEKIQFFKDEEKRQVVGPIMIPNKPIYRRNDEVGEYYIRFTEKAIDDIMYKYSKDGKFNLFNIEHTDQNFDGVTMLEIWKKESDADKSSKYGYELPDGTVFVKAQIEDESLWSSIKTGEINGFSIEIKADIKNSKLEEMSEFNFGVQLGKLEAKYEAEISKLNSQIQKLEEHNEVLLETMISNEDRFAGIEDLKKALELIQNHIGMMEDPASVEAPMSADEDKDEEKQMYSEEQPVAEAEVAEEVSVETEVVAEVEVAEESAVEENLSSEEEEAEKALKFAQEGEQEAEQVDNTITFNAITPDKVNMIDKFFGKRLY